MTDERARAADREPTRDGRTGGSSAAARIQEQARWVDLQVSEAMRRGEFDDLPGTGKPIDDLTGSHDPDWWLKKLIERERITGVLPDALQLRKDDLGLDAHLDRLGTEREVRRELEEFNQRVRRARMQLEGGPPVITPERDVEAEVTAWEERRAARREGQRSHESAAAPAEERRGPTAWLRRRRRTGPASAS